MPDLSPSISFSTGLLDTGAQGSNFISRDLYNRNPLSVTTLSRPTDRIVRLGDSRSLSINLELTLTVAIDDSAGNTHEHSLWYSVLDVLSHDLIIGLVDLIGPYYELFADSVLSSRHLAVATTLCTHLSSLTSTIVSTTNNTTDLDQAAQSLADEHSLYNKRKHTICSSATIASPLVVAPKATAPFIRLCGDYRSINRMGCG